MCSRVCFGRLQDSPMISPLFQVLNVCAWRNRPDFCMKMEHLCVFAFGSFSENEVELLSIEAEPN